MITFAICAAWSLASLLTARKLYARWRGRAIGERECDGHGSPSKRKNSYSPPACCYDSATASDGMAALWAIVTALLWPLVLVVAVVRFRPPLTEAEKAGRRELTEELERELGMGGGE